MTLGSRISKARKDASLSIEELASLTNLRVPLLREIEENDFSHCGGDTYARGHVRNIARKLEADEEEFLRIFDEEQASVKRTMQELLVENNIMRKSKDKRKVSLKTLLLISIVSLGIAAAVQIVISNTSTNQQATPTPTVTETPTASPTPTVSESPTPTASETPAVSESPTPTASPTPSISTSAKPSTQNSFSTGTGVEVVVRAVRANCWLFVSDAAGRTLFSGEISKGSVRRFSTDVRLDLKVGNAGGVDLAVNGKQVAPIGANGAVVSVSYGVDS